MQMKNKKSTLREVIEFYLIDSETLTGKLIDVFIILLNLLVIGIFVAETYDLSEATRALLWKVEVATVSFFVVEYIARLYGAPNRFRQLYDVYSVIDLIAILPTLVLIFFPMANVGVLRIIRIFKD